MHPIRLSFPFNLPTPSPKTRKSHTECQYLSCSAQQLENNPPSQNKSRKTAKTQEIRTPSHKMEPVHCYWQNSCYTTTLHKSPNNSIKAGLFNKNMLYVFLVWLALFVFLFGLAYMKVNNGRLARTADSECCHGRVLEAGFRESAVGNDGENVYRRDGQGVFERGCQWL